MLLRSVQGNVLLLSLLVSSLSLAQSSSSANSSPDPATIMRTALEKFQARSTEARNYVFREHEVLIIFGQNGKRTVSDAYQIMFIGGNPYRVHVEHNNQPIPEEEVEKEKKRLEENARKHLEESRMAQQQLSPNGEVYATAWSRPRFPEIPVERLPDSHKLRLIGTELVDGTEAYVVEAKPMSDHNKSKDAMASSRDLKMKLWIGKDEMQIIKVEATAIRPAFATHPVGATASMGLKTSPQEADKAEQSLQNESTVAYEKGSLFVQQWQKLNNEVWLSKRSYIKGKQIYSLPVMPGRSSSMITSSGPDIEQEVLYSDFKKFHVDTRILPGSDQ